MTDLGDLVYTPNLSSAAVFDQYMQLGLGLGLGLGLDISMALTPLTSQVDESGMRGKGMRGLQYMGTQKIFSYFHIMKRI